MKKLLLFLLYFLSINLYSQNKIYLHQNWEFKNTKDSIWRSAKVPGLVQTDLLDHQLIEDPYFGKNDLKIRKYALEEWEYRCYFFLDEQFLDNDDITIVFEGLDTYADVSLNGRWILHSDNMFRSWKIWVREFLKSGMNTLHIRFKSPLRVARKNLRELPYILPASNDPSKRNESVHIRKAQFQFGWDWAPRLITSGIWKPIYLTTKNKHYINSTKIVQLHQSDSIAYFEAYMNIGRFSTTESDLYYEIFNKTDNKLLCRKKIKKSKYISDYFKIENPKLWWCNGMGEAYLYDLVFRLRSHDTVYDSVETKLGIRTIDLVQEEDETGKSFYFKLNGKPIFIKGANYIPQDALLTRVTNEKYEALISDVKNANMNMLRVWGGGIYESEYFYDLCDKYGILVWQDFMFACSVYPFNTKHFRTVYKELKEQIARINKHPSIAIWCGNNETEVAWFNWGWQKEYDLSAKDSTEIWNTQLSFFENKIPQMVLSENPYANYVHTSPLSNWGKLENFNNSSMHYWGVWHGSDDFSGYEKYVGRFISEYGFQSFPEMANIKSFTPSDQLYLESETIKHHQKSYVGNGKIKEFIIKHFPEPKHFESFIYLSQLTQAYGMEKAINAHRLNKGHCMGTLYWQLNDCWPGPSWSSIDYYGNWKALHYSVRKLYQNIIPIVKKNRDYYQIFLCNDELRAKTVQMKLQLFRFNGDIIWEKDLNTTVENSKPTIAYLLKLNDYLNPQQIKSAYLKVSFLNINENPEDYIFTFVEPKDLALTFPELTYKIKKNKDFLIMEVSAKQFAKSVYISSNKTGVKYSNNFFDLDAGETKSIIIKNAANDATFKITSLYDYF